MENEAPQEDGGSQADREIREPGDGNVPASDSAPEPLNPAREQKDWIERSETDRRRIFFDANTGEEQNAEEGEAVHEVEHAGEDGAETHAGNAAEGEQGHPMQGAMEYEAAPGNTP